MPGSISHALLLTAGLGTRLRPLTFVRAKPAVPVAGDPLVRHIVRWLAGHGVIDLVANLHHLPASITSVLGDGTDLGARIRYSWEQPVVLGSAGGSRKALDLLEADTFLIANGDTMTDFDLAALIDAHQASDGLVTLALTPNHHAIRYGGVRLDETRVTGFVPRGQHGVTSYHFVGVQVASAEVFRALPVGVPLNSIGGVYDDWIARRPGSIRGFVSNASFADIGTVADYWATSLTFRDRGGSLGAPALLAPSARIRESIFWDDVTVGAGAELDECIVTDGVTVPEGAVYRRQILVHTDDRLTATPFETHPR